MSVRDHEPKGAGQVAGALTLGEARLWATRLLARAGDEHPKISAQWLLEQVCGLSRAQLFGHADDPLPLAKQAAYRAMVARRAAGEPLQYIMGVAAFRTIEVATEPGVLIPRPETELLVELALAALDARPKEAAKGAAGGRVLEIGCGTGCVALSLATERPSVRVVTTDISEQAVALATKNRDELGLGDRVEIIQGDLASGVAPERWGTFDVLLSNPPYVPSSLVATLPHEVRAFEPALALDGGPDGLAVYRRILALAPKLLAPQGILAVELFETALGKAARLAQKTGDFEAVDIVNDLTRRPRFLVARSRGR